MFRRGNCKFVKFRQECGVGLRHRAYNVLSGSVLSIWNRIENVIHACTGYQHKMQVIRLKTAEGIKVVGKILIFVFIVKY